MDVVVDWLALAYASFPLLFWVLGSVLVHFSGTIFLWLTKSKGFWRSPYGRWPVQVGRFLYYLGIPYLALGGWPRRPFQGLLSADDMGLVGFGGHWPVTRWLESAGTGLGLGLVALLVLALAWVSANRGGHGPPLRFPLRPGWSLLSDVIYLEAHWAFYRGALAVLMGDVYAGVFLGLGLVYLEWSLDPFWRQGWRLESQAAGRWLHSAMALIVAMLFLFTRNLWICLGVHGLLELCFWQLGRESVTVRSG